MAAQQSKSPPPGGDRYKYDMEQARMLQKKLSNPSLGLNRAISPKNTEQDVALGMQGLEDAEKLASEGSLEEALRIYELSIELLLKCRQRGGNEEMLGKRIRVALTEAEALKERIPKQAASQPSSEAQSMSSRLVSAISGASKKKSPPAKRLSAVKPVSPSNQVVAAAPARRSSKQPSKRKSEQRRRTRLDYDNDPLVQQVKTDLYVDPSELQETTWSDIAGLERAKQSLKESAILPLLRPDLFTGLRKPQNILLYGPPGTGKTMLVKAVAHESSCLLFSCSASTLTSKWHGEGEKLVRVLFAVARDAAPSLVFVDEIDSLLSSRSDGEHEASRRFKTEFMVQMDGMTSESGGLLVVGCTNCPWNVDDAILRRFPRRILIPLPDEDARKGLLKGLLKKAGKHTISSRQGSQLAARMKGFSGSDMSAIASEASFGPIRSLGMEAIQKIDEKQLRPISMQDFEGAIAQSTKSVSPQLLKRYDEWEKQQQAK